MFGVSYSNTTMPYHITPPYPSPSLISLLTFRVYDSSCLPPPRPPNPPFPTFVSVRTKNVKKNENTSICLSLFLFYDSYPCSCIPTISSQKCSQYSHICAKSLQKECNNAHSCEVSNNLSHYQK